MTPEFQSAIDVLLSRLIDIIDKSGQKSIPELDVEFKQAIDEASRKLENSREWKYCKYAIVAWIDAEIIVQRPEWKDNTMESYYFRSGNAYTEFYKRAQRAYEKRYFDAYEVFFICFMFGFRGVYQSSDKSEIPKALPKSDAEWQSQVSRRLRRANKEKSSGWDETQMLDNENHALTGFGSFVNNLLVFLLIAIAAIVFFLLSPNFMAA